MNNSSSEDPECIICMDNTKELLISNSYCDCKIKWHNSCWDKYLKSITIPKCPTCRKTINILTERFLPTPTVPEVQQNITQQIEHITLTLQNLQQVVQERLDEISREQQPQQQQRQQQQQQPENKKKRQLQAFLLILILIGISIGIYKAVI
jgi:hypothetical protein